MQHNHQLRIVEVALRAVAAIIALEPLVITLEIGSIQPFDESNLNKIITTQLGRSSTGMASMMDEMAKTLARRRAQAEKKPEVIIILLINRLVQSREKNTHVFMCVMLLIVGH